MSATEWQDRMKKVYEAVDCNKGEFLDALKELLRRPSVSYTGEGVAECAEQLRNWLESWGVTTRVVPTGGHPVVLGALSPPSASRRVLIYGHYDVKQPGDLSEWETPPFEPVERNGCIYARGATDNKGQLLANALAVRTLHEMEKLPVKVIFLFEGEEEVGSKNLRSFAEAHREELKADLLYASDGPRHFSGRPTVFLGFRGLLRMRLTVRNEVGTHVHSGNFGEIIRNPAWDLVHLLHSMKSPEGEVLIPGYYDDVAPPSPLERQALSNMKGGEEEIRRSLGIERLYGPEGLSMDEKLMFRPTLTLEGFDCGMESTIIPGHATAYLDARLVKDMTPENTFRKIKGHIDAQGVPHATLTRFSSYPPTKTPIDNPFVQIVLDAFENMHAEGILEAPPVLQPTLGGSLGNDIFTETLGLATVWVPYAQPNNGQHGPNEHLRIDHFITGIKMSATALTALGR